jgi:hypothetical protein
MVSYRKMAEDRLTAEKSEKTARGDGMSRDRPSVKGSLRKAPGVYLFVVGGVAR